MGLWGGTIYIYIYIPPLPMKKVDFWGGGVPYIYIYNSCNVISNIYDNIT